MFSFYNQDLIQKTPNTTKRLANPISKVAAFRNPRPPASYRKTVFISSAIKNRKPSQWLFVSPALSPIPYPDNTVENPKLSSHLDSLHNQPYIQI